ncbi:hypothetical protein [Lysinibacillus varians]|uniref:Uncharacterized protein n=1 Tax=Lysinibacillus varians TaxID=1145276 RepID=A0ABY2T622_9BACI|nr:hypothetical protein [Lysinibacillus varians]AHN22028.1 hypothetical protein T479_12125 [Lysinibacillus varians]TKI52680.1 hypothetical protein FC752_19040 [Lysinibacillus varians]
MKKLFYIGVLSTLLLTACGEEEKAAPKEETPAAEEKEASDKVAETKGPTQEELNEKMRKEAIKLEFVAANSDEVAKNTKVTISGKVSNIDKEGVGGKFTVTTNEGDGYGMYTVVNLTLEDVSMDSEVTVYGTFDGSDPDLGFPTIIATIIE